MAGWDPDGPYDPLRGEIDDLSVDDLVDLDGSVIVRQTPQL